MAFEQESPRGFSMQALCFGPPPKISGANRGFGGLKTTFDCSRPETDAAFRRSGTKRCRETLLKRITIQKINALIVTFKVEQQKTPACNGPVLAGFHILISEILFIFSAFR